MFRRVDFPDPDRPATATSSPGARVRSTPRSTSSTRPAGVLKRLVSPVARRTPGWALTLRASPDRLGGGHPKDPGGCVDAGNGPEHERERESEQHQAAREEEQPLSSLGGVRIDRRPDQDRDRRPEHAAAEAHREAFPEHLAQQLKVRGADRLLDPEVPDALE